LELIPSAADVIGFFSVCGFKRGRDMLGKTIDLRIAVSAGEIPLIRGLFRSIIDKKQQMSAPDGSARER